MQTIVITLSNSGGVLDRTALRVDATDEAPITQAVISFIQGSILLPGDTISITEKEAP